MVSERPVIGCGSLAYTPLVILTKAASLRQGVEAHQDGGKNRKEILRSSG
jgi:hypothetical protein